MVWRIPRGDCCYKIKEESDNGSLIKKYCPFFKWIKKKSQTYSPYKDRYGRCNWLDMEDNPSLNNQCKICFIKEKEYEKTVNPNRVFSFAGI